MARCRLPEIACFVQGARGQNSFVIALNRADGKEVWAKALGPIETRMRTNMGAGPRGTPTVDGDRLYVLTENGDLACLKTDGSAVWQMNILKEFGGSQLQWMISESPLIDGRARRRLSRRSGRGHREAGQDDGQDSLDVKGAERYRRLFVDHRRRRPGRAHVHDLHRASGRRRAGLGRQAHVPLHQGGKQRREHCDARLFRQQSVFRVGLRRRRRRCSRSAPRMARWRPPRCTTRRT